MSGSEVLVVAPETAGARLDQFVVKAKPELSRARVQALLDDGHVQVNGKSIKSSYRVKAGDEVALVVPEPVAAIPQAEDLPLRIVHEDKDLLVLDKAAGMVVHPGAGHASGTVVNALLHHVKDLSGVGGELRPGIVHRLDKDTSGLLVIAKSDTSLRALQAAFKSRDVQKTYLALVVGQPPDEGTFRTLHARHPTQRTRFTGNAGSGKPAVTHFKVAKRYAAGARVEVDLETGRTHQIRMHFAEAGFGLFGDTLYASRRALRPEVIDRQALHAWKLGFIHPRTKKPMEFTAPPPKDFKAAEKVLLTLSEHADHH